jgi:hypothetical protein
MKKSEQFNKYSFEQLENMALHNIQLMRKKEERHKNAIEEMLFVRKMKLNNEFVFTQGNIEKILRLNQRFMECFEKLKKESAAIVEELEAKINNNDPFLQDYEIEAKVTPFILAQDEDSGECVEPHSGIYELLRDVLPDFILQFDPRCLLKQHQFYQENEIHCDKSTNWNNLVGAKNGELADHYISYALHELYDHTLYSISDILKINELWVEIKVTYQNFVEKKRVLNLVEQYEC